MVCEPLRKGYKSLQEAHLPRWRDWYEEESNFMYAIFESGGKQYKVAAGDVLRVEKIKGEAGSKVEINQVLAVNNDKELRTGTPYLDAATVNATILGSGKGEKVIIFKFKAKKDYRRKQGHRQPYTKVRIDKITL
jgi:large subunit ribosomal protein L21